jgi:hypothetical protein
MPVYYYYYYHSYKDTRQGAALMAPFRGPQINAALLVGLLLEVLLVGFNVSGTFSIYHA